MHLSMLSPREGGGGGEVRATHRVLTVRSVLRVGILIVQDIPRVGNLTWPPSWITKRSWKSTRDVIIALLLCAARSEGYYFGHLHSPPGGCFWYFWPIMLSQNWGFDSFFFSENVKIPTPCPTPIPRGLTIIGALSALFPSLRSFTCCFSHGCYKYRLMGASPRLTA